jgi:predicted ATP-grasp superfamily ATP-dependent carboligase
VTHLDESTFSEFNLLLLVHIRKDNKTTTGQTIRRHTTTTTKTQNKVIVNVIFVLFFLDIRKYFDCLRNVCDVEIVYDERVVCE